MKETRVLLFFLRLYGLNFLFEILTFDTFDTFDCLAASNWPPGHPRSDHHVSNPHRPDYY